MRADNRLVRKMGHRSSLLAGKKPHEPLQNLDGAVRGGQGHRGRVRHAEGPGLPRGREVLELPRNRRKGRHVSSRASGLRCRDQATSSSRGNWRNAWKKPGRRSRSTPASTRTPIPKTSRWSGRRTCAAAPPTCLWWSGRRNCSWGTAASEEGATKNEAAIHPGPRRADCHRRPRATRPGRRIYQRRQAAGQHWSRRLRSPLVGPGLSGRWGIPGPCQQRQFAFLLPGRFAPGYRLNGRDSASMVFPPGQMPSCPFKTIDRQVFSRWAPWPRSRPKGESSCGTQRPARK